MVLIERSLTKDVRSKDDGGCAAGPRRGREYKIGRGGVL